jgi:hypothetical protein
MSIFISYRRGVSTDIVGRIHDWLERDFPQREIVRDVDSIPVGVKFWKHLERQLEECDLVVAMIGADWHDELAREDDFVRQELEFALKREIPVVPVLVGGVEMPQRSTLPETVREVAGFQAHRIDSGRDFKSDVAELVKALRALRALAAAERGRKLEDDRRKLERERTDRERAVQLEVLRGTELDSLTALLVETTRKRFKAILVLVVGAALVAGVVGAMLWMDAKREARRERVGLEAQLTALRQQLKAQDDRADYLVKQLQNAQDEDTRIELERLLQQTKEESRKILRSGGGIKKQAGSDCNCPPGDPLCSCL